MANLDPIAGLIAFWRADGVELQPPAAPEELDAFEHKHSIHLPPDFRELYQRANGMDNRSADSNFVYFWPLEEIEKENGVQIVDRPDGRWVDIAFLDSMICAPIYWLRISPDGESKIVMDYEGPEKAPVVADSIRDLAAAYPEKGLRGSMSDL